jgi:hypothetical protein
MWCSYATPGDYPPDQRGEDGRALTFDGPACTESVDVLGFPLASLRIAADQTTAMLVVRLCDVAPDGTSLLVSRGLLNLTHRNGHDVVTPIVPGTFMDVVVTLSAAGHTLAAGHRWRLAIAPSYWPHAWPSPEQVTLTLDTANSVFGLPVRMQQLADGTAGQFSQPAGTPLHDCTIVRPDARQRYEHYDQVEQRWELHDENDHGMFSRADGLTYGHRSADRYMLTCNDPLSARSICEHDITIGRGDWQTRIVTWSELRCDRHWFFLDNRITAYEGDVVVAQHAHEHRVRRDGI